MTEIPEHLLKRSKERRAAIGDGDAASEGEPAAASAAVEPAAAAAPAAAAPAAVEEKKPEPPEPVRPEVAAARRRRKIPVWALPVLAGLPLWAYVYQATLEPPPAPSDTPLALGQVIYAGKCSSCHGTDGGGGSGPALTGVLETWPDFRDHAAWVRLGSAGWPGEVYGATGKAKNGGMPAHPTGNLSDEQLAEVVLYERVAFGGMAADDPAYAQLEAIAHGEAHWQDPEVGVGETSQADGVTTEAAFPE